MIDKVANLRSVEISSRRATGSVGDYSKARRVNLSVEFGDQKKYFMCSEVSLHL